MLGGLLLLFGVDIEAGTVTTVWLRVVPRYSSAVLPASLGDFCIDSCNEYI